VINTDKRNTEPNLYGLPSAQTLLSARPESMPLDEALDKMDSLFSEKKKLSVAVNGNSMVPFIYDGDMVVLERLTKGRKIRRGDVLFYLRGDDWAVSRVIKVESPKKYIMCGDAQTRSEGLKRSDVLAVVSDVKGKKGYVSTDSFGWRFQSAVWRLLTPLHGTLLRSIFRFR